MATTRWQSTLHIWAATVLLGAIGPALSIAPSLAAGKATVATQKSRPAVKLRGTSPALPDLNSVAKPAAPPTNGWAAADIAAAKAQCDTLLKGLVLDFSFVAPIRHGACGAAQPVELRSLGRNPAILVQPPAVMNCPLAARLSQWMQSNVQPLARAGLKSEVVAIQNAAAYDCRNRYGDPGQKLSEHGMANALDIGSFTLANGSTVNVKDNWGPVLRDLIATAKSAKPAAAAGFAAKVARADGTVIATPPAAALSAETAAKQHLGSSAIRQAMHDEAAALGLVVPKPATPAANFIHAIHASACTMFGTVLGPEANDAHREHFHVDLAPRSGAAFCE